MKANKLDQFGYQYVNLDDCWSQQSGRDPTTKQIVPDPIKFSKGIKALADHAHSLNFKLGIYSDVGFKTCAGYPGSYQYYELDAKTFAQWGIDFLKLDFCNLDPKIHEQPWTYYEQMSNALNNTGKVNLTNYSYVIFR
jgi:alpha-galactosidase